MPRYPLQACRFTLLYVCEVCTDIYGRTKLKINVPIRANHPVYNTCNRHAFVDGKKLKNSRRIVQHEIIEVMFFSPPYNSLYTTSLSPICSISFRCIIFRRMQAVQVRWRWASSGSRYRHKKLYWRGALTPIYVCMRVMCVRVYCMELGKISFIRNTKKDVIFNNDWPRFMHTVLTRPCKYLLCENVPWRNCISRRYLDR